MKWVEVLLYVHRNRRHITDRSPGRPPRLPHSSWALIAWIVTELFFLFFFTRGGCASCLRECLDAMLPLPRSCQYPHLSEGADMVGGQLREDGECPFSGVTSSGRVWRKVSESDARRVGLAACILKKTCQFKKLGWAVSMLKNMTRGCTSGGLFESWRIWLEGVPLM